MKRLQALIWFSAASACALAAGSLRAQQAFVGPYAGAEVGYARYGTDESYTQANPAFNYRFDDLSGSGIGGGLFGGYGERIGNIYLGGELSIGASDSRYTLTIQRTRLTREANLTLGLVGRAGYVLREQTLFYAKAGLAATRFETRYTEPGITVDDDQMLVGAILGAGIEYAVTSRISVRLDYTHTFYEDGDLAYDRPLTGQEKFETQRDNVMVGVSWRF